MTVTNHVLAGAVIAITIQEPVAAISLAVISHFIMDALPHFGYPGKRGFTEVLRHRLSYVFGVFTILSTLAIIIILVLHSQWFALAIGIIAALPDAVAVYNYLAYEKKGVMATTGLALLHVKYHRRIQWCERPWGGYIEIAVFIIMTLLLLKLL